MLTLSQSGISSTTSIQQHTTVTDRWILQAGGSACLSVKSHCQIPMCMTPHSTERLRCPRLPISDDESYLASKQSMTILPSIQNWLSRRNFPALPNHYLPISCILTTEVAPRHEGMAYRCRQLNHSCRDQFTRPHHRHAFTIYTQIPPN